MLKKIGKIFRVLLFVFIGVFLVLLVWGEIERTTAGKNGRFSQQPSQYPIRQSDITMYADGKQLNNQLFSDIKKAKDYVHINFFSIADDKVSHQFLELLRQKSQEGVEVYYALDRLGGILLKKKERELLVKKACILRITINLLSLIFFLLWIIGIIAVFQLLMERLGTLADLTLAKSI
jgi:cardiolipin synthase